MTRRSLPLSLLGLLLVHGAAACATAPSSQVPSDAAPPDRCHYDVRLADPQSGLLDVAVRCEGGNVYGFVASEAVMAKHVHAQHRHSGELVRSANRFVLPKGADATIRYQLSLDAVAYDTADIDVAYKSGPGWIAAASTWLLLPDPVGPDTVATFSVDTSAGGSFASGMHRDSEGRYSLAARRIPFATYGVFGEFASRTLGVPGPLSLTAGHDQHALPEQAQIEMVVLPGELSVDVDTLAGWLHEAATAVGNFWGGFPVERVCVVMIPLPGYAKVVHGKVVSAGGPTVALQLGGRFDAAHLHDDWILVHELFHLGFPTFPHNGKWLDEGLATYYEPIIRTRAGWRSETDLWQEFAYDMPQGLDAMQQYGLENARDFKDIYWGGALFAFTADLTIRQQSNNQLALEDGLRAVLAQGGHAGNIWTVDQAIAIIDGRIGRPLVSELLARHRTRGQPLDFTGWLDKLGVDQPDGGIALDDSAPLAPLRRALVAGGTPLGGRR